MLKLQLDNHPNHQGVYQPDTCTHHHPHQLHIFVFLSLCLTIQFGSLLYFQSSSILPYFLYEETLLSFV